MAAPRRAGILLADEEERPPRRPLRNSPPTRAPLPPFIVPPVIDDGPSFPPLHDLTLCLELCPEALKEPGERSARVVGELVRGGLGGAPRRPRRGCQPT